MVGKVLNSWKHLPELQKSTTNLGKVFPEIDLLDFVLEDAFDLSRYAIPLLRLGV